MSVFRLEIIVTRKFCSLTLALASMAVLTYGATALAQTQAEKVARGKYLVETIAGCANCHTPRNPDGSFNHDMAYAGAFVIEEPVFKAYARNITPDPETGIGGWTEDQIVRALRDGIHPDGHVLGPPMSFGWYRRISDTDAYAMAAFLKTVPAVRNEVPPSEFKIPLPGYGPLVEHVPDVPRDDPVKYGEYLAGPVGHCMDCHTTYVEGQIDMTQLGKGGNIYPRPFIYEWSAVSRNITSHPMYGLGNWTDAEIKRAIVDGIGRDGRTMLDFMPYELYKGMEERDLNAIIAYLRSLPPLGP